MLKKNEFTIGVLALLLSIGLVGSAFASDRNYIELDESDYSEVHNGFDENQTYRPVQATVAQTPEAVVTGWVNLIELDESDYNEVQYGFDANQTHRSAQAAVAQTQESSATGWVNLIELDESDYKYVTPGNA